MIIPNETFPKFKSYVYWFIAKWIFRYKEIIKHFPMKIDSSGGCSSSNEHFN